MVGWNISVILFVVASSVVGRNALSDDDALFLPGVVQVDVSSAKVFCFDEEDVGQPPAEDELSCHWGAGVFFLNNNRQRVLLKHLEPDLLLDLPGSQRADSQPLASKWVLLDLW